MSDLFIGVVSHEGSRFARSQGPEGLASRLAIELAALGVTCEVVVNTTDLLEPGSPLVTPAAVQRSLTAQVTLDRRWAAYLGRPRGARWWAGHGLRWGRRAQLRAQPPSVAMLTRLLNIELSHLDLLRRAVDSSASWALILEDDADSPDVVDLAAGLTGIMRSPSTHPAYVNVSHSFSPTELGINHLLSPAAGVTWQGPRIRTIMSARKPVTNTVCAIAYRTSFLPTLLTALDRLPMDPVVPIDWKLNLALMDLAAAGALGDGACWQVEPAPIVQMSMQVPA